MLLDKETVFQLRIREEKVRREEEQVNELRRQVQYSQQRQQERDEDLRKRVTFFEVVQ